MPPGAGRIRTWRRTCRFSTWGHCYATVRITRDAIDTEFVCIQRPLERSSREDGGPLIYRIAHRAALWSKGERPKLEERLIEGNPTLSI